MNDFLKVKNQYEIILIDFPFGYEHAVLKPHIDRVVYLKTPLDIAFARQVVRDYSDYDKESILNWAKCYLNKARPIFIEHEKVVSETADLILDGSLPLAEQVKQLKKQFGI